MLPAPVCPADGDNPSRGLALPVSAQSGALRFTLVLSGDHATVATDVVAPCAARRAGGDAVDAEWTTAALRGALALLGFSFLFGTAHHRWKERESSRGAADVGLD